MQLKFCDQVIRFLGYAIQRGMLDFICVSVGERFTYFAFGDFCSSFDVSMMDSLRIYATCGAVRQNNVISRLTVEGAYMLLMHMYSTIRMYVQYHTYVLTAQTTYLDSTVLYVMCTPKSIAHKRRRIKRYKS